MHFLKTAASATIAIVIAASPATAWSKDPAYAAYRRAVDRETAKTYRENRAWIDPMGLRGKARGHDLDHITPVKQCWLGGETVKSCAAPTNLRMLDASKNRSEGCRAKNCRTATRSAP